MFCIYCGKEIRDEARFCHQCGKETKQARTMPREQVRVISGTNTIKNCSNRNNSLRILIILFGIIVALGTVIGISKNGKIRHDKSYVHTGNCETAKNNLGSLGYVLQDEDKMSVDIDMDGSKEKVQFYIDRNEAYVEIDGEIEYIYYCNALCEDYLIILPIEDGTSVFIFTKRNEEKDAYFSYMACYYNGEIGSEMPFTMAGCIADGGLIVENDYRVHLDWQSSSDYQFESGEIHKHHYF